MKKLCLNMIVKNEADRILRAISSAAPYISCAVIADTGSTDGTPQLMQRFFEEAKIPFKIVSCEFRDFSYARNCALTAAWESGFQFDYLLLFDADMELKVNNPAWADNLDGDAYCLLQNSGPLWYYNARLMRSDVRKYYLSPTHEYLDVPPVNFMPKEEAYFYDHADGANRPDKAKRDIMLLEKALKKEPNNPRYMYYIAQSYMDVGKPEKAAKWYKKRVETPGWDQETWHAKYQLAHAYRAMGKEAKFVHTLLEAYNMRPSRTEPLYDLARMYRDRGYNFPSVLFSEAAMHTPPSNDALFVNDYIQKVGAREEFAICGYYVPWKQHAARLQNNWLQVYKGPYGNVKEIAARNAWFYQEPLVKYCPSYTTRPVPSFKVPENYVAMNPSICRVPDGMGGDRLAMIVRTVNYRIINGNYFIRATDGTANNTNPIHTRNFLVFLNDDLSFAEEPLEILPPADWPVHYPFVVGQEDMRLYHSQTELWASATVRQLTPEGFCEQVRTRLDMADYLSGVVRAVEPTRMLMRGYEKNWMPILNGKQEFMYRLDEVVDGEGRPVAKWDVPIDVSNISGGTQLVSARDGWIALVHEARNIPEQPVRYYSHRFVVWDHEFKLKGMTLPFYFDQPGIEYAAGLAKCGDSYVISYGFRDEEAKLATVKIAEVEKLLFLS